MSDATNITETQEKLTYLEKYVADLDSVVRDLGERVDQQARAIQRLRTSLDQCIERLDLDRVGDDSPEG